MLAHERSQTRSHTQELQADNMSTNNMEVVLGNHSAEDTGRPHGQVHEPDTERNWQQEQRYKTPAPHRQCSHQRLQVSPDQLGHGLDRL